ncbi:hypothetical protein Tco_0099279 [Tanacetum coccineum]
MLYELWGGVNLVHTYYNGAPTRKDKEEPSWDTKQYSANSLGTNTLDNNEEADGHDTNGQSDVQTSIPTMENTRPISYIYAVRKEPTIVPGLDNDVTKGHALTNSSMIFSGPASYVKLVIGELSRKSVNFRSLLAPAGSGDGVAISLVKFYGVPMTKFSEDGLSFIATKLVTPLMLDSYTTDMCMKSWGRSSYVRAMIKL